MRAACDLYRGKINYACLSTVAFPRLSLIESDFIVFQPAEVRWREHSSVLGISNVIAPHPLAAVSVTAFSYSWYQHIHPLSHTHPPQPLQFQISLNTIRKCHPQDRASITLNRMKSFASTPHLWISQPYVQSENDFIAHPKYLIPRPIISYVYDRLSHVHKKLSIWVSRQ